MIFVSFFLIGMAFISFVSKRNFSDLLVAMQLLFLGISSAFIFVPSTEESKGLLEVFSILLNLTGIVFLVGGLAMASKYFLLKKRLDLD